MSDGDALLAAILAHPGEDTPRLAYADWLEENGNPGRAEFVRVQCAVAAIEAAGTAAMIGYVWDAALGATRVEGGPDRDRLIEFRARESALFRALDPLSLVGAAVAAIGRPPARGEPTLTRHPTVPWVRVERAAAEFAWLGLVRGLVGDVQLAAGDWVRCADALRAVCPVTRAELRGLLPWRGDEGGRWLAGDPAGVRLAWPDVRAAATAEERAAAEWQAASCGLRWPGVAVVERVV